MNPHHLLHTEALDWVPLVEGISFKPVSFPFDVSGLPDDSRYQLLLRVEPGTVVPRHRHTGEVHAFVLSGVRRIAGTGDDIGPGTYVHEPVGNVDTWWTVGDEPCVVHIATTGGIDYLGDDGEVVRHTDATTARTAYLRWCEERGVAPEPALVGSATP